MKIQFRKNVSPSDSNGQLTDSDLRLMENNGHLRSCRLEYKLDGSRYLLHLHAKGNHLTSRRESVKTGEFVDRIEQTPKFKKLAADKYLEGVVLDMEVRAPFDGGVRAVTSVIGSNPDKAIAKQKEKGWLFGIVFDMLFGPNDEDLRDKPFGERRRRLKEVMKYIWTKYPWSKKYLKLYKQYEAASFDEVQKFFVKSLKKGYEGLMIKDVLSKYGTGMWKWKVERDTCVVITGFTKGNGKYTGQIGAIKFSVYQPVKDRLKRVGKGKDEKQIEHELELVEVGQCSGIDDRLRKLMSKKKSYYMGQVIEIRGQEWTGKRVRHARFIRMREDYPKFKCTLHKFLSDLNIVETTEKKG
ncbi:MAG TPA: hypothetical protein VEF04_02855 [Blastocatellia bacterium]|nr:hypothetical protein [Blastocatellia bacterium]